MVPSRPAISNVLIKASTNRRFRTELLANPPAALAAMNLPAPDVEVPTSIGATNLKEYTWYVKLRLSEAPTNPGSPRIKIQG